MERRTFIKNTGIVAGAAASTSAVAAISGIESIDTAQDATIELTKTNSNFEREPLIRPFGFKGGYISEIWQTVSCFQSAKGTETVGLCTQNVLWSDAKVFARHSENGGNALMYAISERAGQMLKGERFTSPVTVQESIIPELYKYATKICSAPDLRMTFLLNALVGVDNALWVMYARENGLKNFDDMIPKAYRPALSSKHDKVASIPLMAYSVPISEIEDAAADGYFFMKIKIGQPGTQAEMLEKDKARITAIHKAIGHIRTPYTKDGKLPYYFDANGRYKEKDTLMKLLDQMKSIGALEQVQVIEEPFPENAEIDVSDIPLRIAADESAHTDKDALERIEMGYKAIALKPIAKTMSMTMKIAQTAHDHGVPCFCADLTVNPILIEWNKVVASRLAPFPGLGMGLLETNGHQNYKKWDQMLTYHPYPEASWTQTKGGTFSLSRDYYHKSGGILVIPEHYMDLCRPPY